MGKSTTKPGSPAALRQQAEGTLKHNPAKHAWPQDIERLVYELEVHQIELELQNDELRAAQSDLTESRDRYYELYDLAPIGYLTLDRSSKIYEANLAAAELSGVERAHLIGRSLSSLMQQQHADSLYRHLQRVFANTSKQGCDLVLGAPGRQALVHLDSISFAGDTGERTQCHSVLIDLSQLRDAQDGLRASEARGNSVLNTASARRSK